MSKRAQVNVDFFDCITAALQRLLLNIADRQNSIKAAALLIPAAMGLSCGGTRYEDASAALIPAVDQSIDRQTPRDVLVYINSLGKIVLRTPYRWGGYFSEGLAQVSDDGGCGYIDSKGRKIFWAAGAATGCDDFSEGMAVVQTGSAECRYIGRNGNWAIPQTFKPNNERMPDRHRFRDGRAAVLLDKGWGFIDRTGGLVGQFDEVRWFHEGLAAVKLAGKWGFVDTSGKIKIAPRFDAVSHWVEGEPLAACFSDGLAAVRFGKFWGYIDKTGAFVILPQFDEATEFHEGLAAVKLKGVWKYIDEGGKVLFDAGEAVLVGNFSEGLAALHFEQCSIDDGLSLRSGYIDRTGKRVLPVQYLSASKFRNGLASVRMDGNIHTCIDHAGRQVFTVAKAYDPADTMARIRNSTDVSWLKRIVLEPNLAATLAKEPLARGGVLGIKASAYCRLGDLATEESLSAVREIERRAALVPPAPPRACYGSSPAPSFHYDNQEITPVATSARKDGLTYALIAGNELGDLDVFVTSSRTPNDKASWTRPKLIPNRFFMSIRDPRLVVDGLGQM
ncbi:MAG TPA: WG repeat-containing protein, partial [Acidobacteriota bacterium]|nr:WG repeat-containing protein [Acidobacteriota bacterium]